MYLYIGAFSVYQCVMADLSSLYHATPFNCIIGRVLFFREPPTQLFVETMKVPLKQFLQIMTFSGSENSTLRWKICSVAI